MNLALLGSILLTGVLLGSSIVIARMGVLEIPPYTQVGLRLTVATVAYAVLVAGLRKRLPTSRRCWLDIAVVGVTNTAVPVLTFTAALQFVSSGVVALIIALVPIFTGVMAHWWLAQERLHRSRVAGLTVGFLGVALLILTRTTGLAGSGGELDVRGPLLSLAGVLFGSASAVYTRLRLRQVDALVVAAGQNVVAWAVVLPLALVLSPVDLSAISPRGWFSVAYNGLVSSFAGILVIFYMIRRFGATPAALSTYVIPLVSVSLGAVLLGEVITLPLVGGAGLILAGVYLAGRRPRGAPEPRPAEAQEAAPAPGPTQEGWSVDCGGAVVEAS